MNKLKKKTKFLKRTKPVKKLRLRDYFRKSIFSNYFIDQFKTWNFTKRSLDLKPNLDWVMVKLRNYTLLYAHYTKHRFFYRNLRQIIEYGFSNIIFLFLLIFCVILYLFISFFSIVSTLNHVVLFGSVFIISDAAIFCISVVISTVRILFVLGGWGCNLILNLVMFQLVPELILLIAAIIIILIKSWSTNYYDSNFNHILLKNVFNNEYYNKRNSFKAFNVYLVELKRRTILLVSYYIGLASIIISFVWIVFTSLDFIHTSNFSLSTVGVVDKVNYSSCMFTGMNDIYFGNHFYYDNITFIARITLLIVGFFYFLLLKNELILDNRIQKIEFLLLVIIGLLLSLLMVSTASLLSLFLVIEGVVMIMYLMAAAGGLNSIYPLSKIFRYRAVEGSLKYIITNAVASGFFLLGSFLISLYSAGDIYFESLNSYLATNTDIYGHIGLLIGLIFISITFLFKIGAVPFHAWMADLYESSSSSALAFFLLIPKIAVLFTLLNLYRFLFNQFSFVFFIYFTLIGTFSLVIGAISASSQVKINRVLAYSSVSQAGALLILFGLLGLVTINNINVFVILSLFIISYSLIMLHFASIYNSIKQSNLVMPFDLVKTLSLFKTVPLILRVAFTFFIFNLSGMPPLLGWIIKSSILVSCLLVSFNLFDIFNSSTIVSAESIFKSISALELSALSFFFNKIEHSLFYIFLIASIVIFLALLVSIHYSMQLFKVSFFEFNNISNENLQVDFLPVPTINSLIIFLSLLVNLSGFVLIFSFLSLFLL